MALHSIIQQGHSEDCEGAGKTAVSVSYGSRGSTACEIWSPCASRWRLGIGDLELVFGISRKKVAHGGPEFFAILPFGVENHPCRTGTEEESSGFTISGATGS